MPGPLEGLRAVEMVGLGPGPFCGMLLADMGAEVLRVDRVDAARAVDHSKPATSAIDLKQPDGVEALLRLLEQADAFFEVFRPGVAERLGIGPDVALARNTKLVYGRLTGWGQDGPYAQAAGHDIDYIALAGALEPLGRAGEKPTPPINVLGDFAGGWIEVLVQPDLEILLLGSGAMIGKIEALRDQRVDVDRPAFARALARVQQHVLDDRICPFAVLHHFVEIAPQRFGQLVHLGALVLVQWHALKGLLHFDAPAVVRRQKIGTYQ